MRSALAFLTTLPLGRGHTDLGQATLVGFPAVGLVLGTAWWVVAAVGVWVWGPVVAAALVLATDLILTGGLHLDAVADVGDGVASRRQGDALREVLRDARVGAVGAATLGTVLLVRFAAIAGMVADRRAGLLILAPAIGRAGMVLALAVLPRTTGSLSSGFVDLARGPAVAGAMVLLVLSAGVVGTIGARPAHAGGAAALGAVVAVVVAVAWRRRHGFASGDVVGAAGLLAETAALLALAV